MSRLIDEINKYKESFRGKVPKEIQETMLKATKELEGMQLSRNSLQVGSKANDFLLTNVLNKKVSLKNLLEKKDFVVLNFYRGLWCPYCNLELQALQNINDELISLNAKLVALSPQTPDSSLSTKEKNELEFEVLSDTDNLTAKEYGLVFSLNDKLKPIYKSFGIDIPTSNANSSYELPMPAIFVINKQQEIIYSFIDEDYTKRCEPQNILDIIKENIS